VNDTVLVLLLLLVPIAGFVLTAAFGRRLGHNSWAIAVAGIVVTWAIATLVVYRALSGQYGPEGLQFTLYTWIPTGPLGGRRSESTRTSRWTT